MFNVPLIGTSTIVLHPLDTVSTAAVDPDGVGPKTTGYDYDLREPISYEYVDPVDGSVDVKNTVRYKVAVRIPCQVEVQSFEKLKQAVQGDLALSSMVFVVHRDDLRALGLLGVSAGKAVNCGPAPLAHGCMGGGGAGSPTIKKNDMISSIEKTGFVGEEIQALENPLFIAQISPGSWGMGDDGTNLYMLYTSTRPNFDTPGR
jgi:hypothetical protein